MENSIDVDEKRQATQSIDIALLESDPDAKVVEKRQADARNLRDAQIEPHCGTATAQSMSPSLTSHGAHIIVL